MSEQALQRSLELFRSGFFCAESVLQAIAESQHIQSDLIPRIATGFCSGLARTGGMCGAVSGGIMAISLFYGRNSPTERVDRCYEAERDFMKRFSTQFGELNCQKLTGVHLGTAEGQAAFKEKD